jgi:hypothetical protein
MSLLDPRNSAREPVDCDLGRLSVICATAGVVLLTRHGFSYQSLNENSVAWKIVVCERPSSLLPQQN